MDNSQDNGRRQNCVGTFLKAKVAEAVSSARAGRMPFTAYDITLQLRDENPTYEIVHDDVRQAVREVAPAYGYDDGVMTDFGAYQATVYSIPPPQPVVPVATQPSPYVTLPSSATPITTPLKSPEPPTSTDTELLPGIKPL